MGKAKDVYDFIRSLEDARERNYDPRTGIDVLTNGIKAATNAIPNSRVRQVAREILAEINSAGNLGVQNIDRYQDRLREAAGQDGVPGFSPAGGAVPPPPGFEWQPTVEVTDNGRTFSQGPDRAVPIGDRLPNDRPYYTDSGGNRIYPPPGGWAESGIPITGTEANQSPGTVVAPEVNTDYTAARGWTLPRDPLVLDLDGDGIETVGINPLAPVLFDHDNDGVRTGTGWIKSDDGLLVLDRNGNGTIDGGAELFGDNTPGAAGALAANGYIALQGQDSNGDGQINSQDASYTQLRVWRDLNQDGLSQAGELQTLGQAGIASIGVAGTTTNVNLGNGNTQIASGSFTRTNGSTGQTRVRICGSKSKTNRYVLRSFSRNYLLT